tara:strand:- start:2107 stop:2232 length:126 start_codon:yes stop_codon:yes gene_type:complete
MPGHKKNKNMPKRMKMGGGLKKNKNMPKRMKKGGRTGGKSK